MTIEEICSPPKIRCLHGLSVSDHCDQCMTTYFGAVGATIDKAAYMAMREAALGAVSAGAPRDRFALIEQTLSDLEKNGHNCDWGREADLKWCVGEIARLRAAVCAAIEIAETDPKYFGTSPYFNQGQQPPGTPLGTILKRALTVPCSEKP
jgi:hypothetical protein